MSGIFISYRRDDSQTLAGRLFDRLVQRFGKEHVFRDIDAIEPGARFAEVIGERIGKCDALVALIGTGWLDAKDTQGQRRLDLPDDFVKAEIAEALVQNKLVIPALIEGASMPARDALPPEIAALADHHALPVSDSRFDFDVGRLIAAIEKVGAPQGTAHTPWRTDLLARIDERSPQRTLAFLGIGIVVLAGAGWMAYVHFMANSATSSSVSATQGGIAAGGNVAPTAAPGGVAVVATGPVTIGITLAEYEERIKRRERELREEFANTSRSERDRITELEKQLAAAEALARSPEEGLEKYKEVLAGSSQSLKRLGLNVPAAQLERARKALARGDSSEAERLFKQGLRQDKVRAADAAYQLGRLAESDIDYASAAKYYGEAVKLEPESPQYLNAAGNMARTLGRYDEAQPLLERALAIRKKSLGAGHPDVATSLNNLAALYGSQGQYAKAEPLYQQALAIFKNASGTEHPAMATSLNNLAELYRAQGQYAKAAPLYQHALAIKAKNLGTEHPAMATSLNNLAGLYYAKGQYAKAEPLYRQALAIRRKVLGTEHPDVASSLNNLAELYGVQGQYTKAEPLHQQALAIRKKVLGTEHPDVAASLNNLAELYRAQGQYARAEPLYQQALAIRKKTFGAEHPEVAQSLNNLAVLYYEQGQYAKAEPLYEQALAIWQKTLGSEHPDVALSLNNLAALYYAQGQYAKAEPLFAQVLAIWRKTLGPEHPDVATVLEDYAMLLTKMKRDKEAADLRAQAKAIRMKLAG